MIRINHAELVWYGSDLAFKGERIVDDGFGGNVFGAWFSL